MSNSDLDDVIDTLQSVIHQTDEQIKCNTDDWVLYIPSDNAPKITDYVDTTRQTTTEYEDTTTKYEDTTLFGHKWEIDHYIDDPQLLPDSVQDLTSETYCLRDPPYSLVQEWVQIHGMTEKSTRTPMVGTRTTPGCERILYTVRPFYNIRRRHHKLNDTLIRRYDLDVPSLPDTDPDDYDRVKMGNQVVKRNSAPADLSSNIEAIRRQFIERIIEKANSVSRREIVGQRKRRIEFPYKFLDFYHREEIRCGTSYTHYGGVFLKPLEIRDSTEKINELNGSPQRFEDIVSGDTLNVDVS